VIVLVCRRDRRDLPRYLPWLKSREAAFTCFPPDPLVYLSRSLASRVEPPLIRPTVLLLPTTTDPSSFLTAFTPPPHPLPPVPPLIAHPRYHLKDVIVGKIYFLLVRIKIKHMELSIIRRETTGAAPNQYNESETITKFEIMDGAPVRGETIPIRLFLGGFELTPTFRDVNKKFSTRYYLNLVLIDEENRRYFKQQEITVFRIP